MAGGKLDVAKNAKNDEFYTRLEDIEREMLNYKEYFRNKVVYCNCDDPEWSKFYFFFKAKMESYGIKKLITTHYDTDGQSYAIIREKGKVYEEEPPKIKLKGNGDFRTDECIDFLKESDIVVTNPPFSLFREYINLLVKNKKKFIVIGNKNSIAYKDIFKLIMENKIWLGVTTPTDFYTDKNFKELSGKLQGLTRWFTNIEHKKRNDEIFLIKKYNEEDYPKYDNYDAISVNKVKDIPRDYKGLMGVPLSFLDNYNPKQFSIIGNEIMMNIKSGRFYEKGKRLYARILIRRK